MAPRRDQSGGSVSPVARVPASPSKALLTYNFLRLLLLAACLGLGYLATLRGLVLIVAALAVSGILSWFLLAKQRIGMGLAVEQAVSRGRVKLADDAAKEDEYADALLANHAADDQPKP